MKISKITTLVVVMVVLGALIGLALNPFSIPIEKRFTNDRNNNNDTKIYLNSSITPTGLYNYSLIDTTMSNYTIISVNTTYTYNSTFDLRFKITISNSSAITNETVQVSIDGVNYGTFLNSFAQNFSWNTLFTHEFTNYNLVYIRFNGTITSNFSISTYAQTIEYYQDSTTDTINIMYAIIPIMAVVGIMILFVEFQKNED